MCVESSIYKYIVFLFSWSAFFFGYYFRNCITPIVDVLEEELDTNATGVGTVGSFIHLWYFWPQILFGILLQFVDGRKVLPFSVLGVGCASLLFSYSTNVRYATFTASIAGFSAGKLSDH